MEKMYSFDEIGLIPIKTSSINSRKEVDPFYNGKLPIFVAPMTCILNKDNYDLFNTSSIIPIYPIKFNDEFRYKVDGWVAVTLHEFKEQFCTGKAIKNTASPFRILIDCANGHMKELYSSVKIAKEIYKQDLEVMVGNIANAETYIDCCESYIDYVRVGIGGGSGCTTSVQTGFHASLPWLLTKIKLMKKVRKFKTDKDPWGSNFFETKIIADGGINSIEKAIKALALGADYVMMGRCFAQCEESCAEGKTCSDGQNWKHYYGQSSELGQLDRFGKIKSNPEGCDIWIPVISTLQGFTNKFEACLRSAMSYAGTKTLNDFVGKVNYEIQSISEFNNYNK